MGLDCTSAGTRRQIKETTGTLLSQALGLASPHVVYDMSLWNTSILSAPRFSMNTIIF